MKDFLLMIAEVVFGVLEPSLIMLISNFFCAQANLSVQESKFEAGLKANFRPRFAEREGLLLSESNESEYDVCHSA